MKKWMSCFCAMVLIITFALAYPVFTVNAKEHNQYIVNIEYRNNRSGSDKIIETAIKKAHISLDKVKYSRIVFDKISGEGVVQITERKNNIVELTNIMMYRKDDKGKLENAIIDNTYTTMSYFSDYIPFEFVLDWSDINIPITIVTTGLSYTYFVGSPVQCVYMKPFNIQARWYRSDSSYSVTRIQAEHYMQAPKYHFPECLDDNVYSDSDLIPNQKCTMSATLNAYYPTINTTYYGYNSLASDIAMGLNSSDALDEYNMWYMILHYLEYEFWYSVNGVPSGYKTARFDYYDTAYPDT